MSATDRKMKMAELRIENNNLRDERNAHVRTNAELLKECYALRAENERLEQRVRKLEEMQRWTPVSERLPEKNQLIDGYDLSTMSRMNGWYCGQDVHGKYVLSDGEFEYWFTHWRPLPEPPEVEE